MGTLYNVEANFFVKTVIFRFGSCAVANYELRDDGSLNVVNTGVGPFGQKTSIEGVAVPMTDDPGKFFLTQGGRSVLDRGNWTEGQRYGSILVRYHFGSKVVYALRVGPIGR